MADIKSLPDEIMIEIFGNLSPKMIKTCSLVCKSWDGIIAETTTLMEKFRLNLEKSEESIIAAKDIRRKHQSAFIKDFSQDTLDVICMHNLKSLTVSFYAKQIKASELVETLNNLPALKIFNAIFMDIEDDISKTANFKKIRTNLKELLCCADIIHIIDCCTLTTLYLMSDEPYNYSVKLLIDFLSQQKELKELDLCYMDDLFSTDEIFGLQFSLKTLIFTKDEPFRHYERFKQFLQLQKHSLTRLELRFWTEPPFEIEQIHNFVIENMTKLTHLVLDDRSYEDSDEDYLFTFKDLSPEMYVAKNIEILDFSNKYDLNDTKRFFEMLPNLKRLTFDTVNKPIDFNDIQLLLHISAINTKLEALKINKLAHKNLSDVNFPNLKELSVDSWIDNVLCTFINNHSKTLEKIIFTSAVFVSELAAKEIMNCENLKSLKLICRSSSSFSSLKWLRDVSSKVSSLTFIAQVPLKKQVFKFPDDKAIWDELIKFFNEYF